VGSLKLSINIERWREHIIEEGIMGVSIVMKQESVQHFLHRHVCPDDPEHYQNYDMIYP
jgi:hypothetical protein